MSGGATSSQCKRTPIEKGLGDTDKSPGGSRRFACAERKPPRERRERRRKVQEKQS